jgi:hypothetical protein
MGQWGLPRLPGLPGKEKGTAEGAKDAEEHFVLSMSSPGPKGFSFSEFRPVLIQAHGR